MPEVRYDFDTTDGVAMLTLDCDGPLNTIGSRLVADLEAAWRRAERERAHGVLLCSAKEKSFLDGANLVEILKLDRRWGLGPLLERFQSLMAAMAASPVPVVGVLGSRTALGGGFELLLWTCDQVIATSGARVGLPEVGVGLFPAGGGTHTLPRAIGLEAALEMMTTGRIVPAERLEPFGFLDVVDRDPVEAALEWLAENPTSANRNLSLPPVDDQTEEVRQRLLHGYRERLTRSPYRPWIAALLDSVEQGLERTVEEAARADIPRFIELTAHPNTRNTIDFFFLNTSVAPKLARSRAEAARPVERLAILGGGLMGRGIAQVAADRGLDVQLVDVDTEHLQAAVSDIGDTLGKLVDKGRWSPERRQGVLDHIHTTLDYDELAEIPLVIEAVFENLELKRRLLRRVQEVNRDAIFASNTSTIPMQMIAQGAVAPQQVVGMHFFSPVPLMALLEVIEGPQTSAEALATAVAVGRAIGKTCITVGDGPGFYTSRTFGTYVLTGIMLAELGMRPQEVDGIALAAGFPQGPLHVYGTAGGEVIYHASRFIAERLPHQPIPDTLENLFRAGYVGAGKPCFYTDAKGTRFDETVLELIAHRDGPTPDEEDARDTLLLGMVNEAFRCVEEGVVRDMATLDIGAVLGIGFPQCWHGPARYLGQRGVHACRDRLAELFKRYGEPQLEPCRELDRLIACGVNSSLI
jgi:3-hydroxyacyl-CoA dehydrogenase / enoyl-CoA hydratase / 3-hydroxybutyryl-CoA epimerase